jgi:hypothetical protein
MSQEKSHFRIKRGDIEIEFAGDSTEVAKRYAEALEWIKTVTGKPAEPKVKKVKEEKEIAKETEKKSERRGGRRTSTISKEIDKLIESGWLDEFKEKEEVQKELKRLAIPASIQAVNISLTRRVGKTLDRIKKDNKWVYRKMSG